LEIPLVPHYTLEIYEPDSREDVLAVLTADYPFLQISSGDLIHPAALAGGSRLYPDRLRVTNVEHILLGKNDTKHKICVYTARVSEKSAYDPDTQFSKKERWLYSNLLRLLEAAFPTDADDLAVHREALEEGYELHYAWLFERFWEGLSPPECKEVIDILDMYRAITFSLQTQPNREELEKSLWYPFPGFDGNNETAQMAYCRYFVHRLGRFQELAVHGERTDFNSHMPMLPQYRRMLELWRSHFEKSFELSRDAIKVLLEAR
jgi:uncharacterized protein YfbU (UPF0304 family)